MTATATQETETLINILRDAAADLSPSVVNALIARPDAVRGALAATGALLARDEACRSTHDELETIGLVEEPTRSPEEVRRIVEGRTIPYEPDEEVLNSNEVAARLGLKSRQSVHDWLRKGKIVGWQTAKRRIRVPGPSSSMKESADRGPRRYHGAVRGRLRGVVVVDDTAERAEWRGAADRAGQGPS